MKYESFIALRYFRAKRRTGFISIITYVSVLGIIIGVAALDIVLSVYNGFEGEVRGRLINSDAHIHLRKYHNNEMQDYQQIMRNIDNIPHIVGMSPVMQREGAVRFGKLNTPCVVKGLDPLTAGKVSVIPERIVSGQFDLGMVTVDGVEYPGIVLGRWLAEQLLIFSHDVRDSAVVALFGFDRQASILTRPQVRKFVVTGIVELGFYEYDLTHAYISLEMAQNLYKAPGSCSRIEIKLDDYEAAGKVAPLIEERLGGYPFNAMTWFEKNKSLYSWMALEKRLFTAVLSLIILVAAFNIVSSLVMIVMEKTRDIGILKSMGASARGIMRIFLNEGLIIGVLGVSMGSFLGFAICWIQQEYEIVPLPPEVYIINSMPVEMFVSDFILVACIGMALCILAAIYPAYKAAKLEPVDAIRYE